MPPITMTYADIMEQPSILEDIFIIPSHPTACVVYLTEKGIAFKAEGKAKNGHELEGFININDVIGSSVMRGVNRSDSSGQRTASCYLCIYSCPLKSKGGLINKQMRRERSVVTFKIQKYLNFEENVELAHKWHIAISWLIRGKQLYKEGTVTIPSSPPLPRNLLIFINPHSGSGKGLQIFKDGVAPLLEDSDTQYKLIITVRANHCRDFVKAVDLSCWDGIVVVSGDGLLYEVYNGLMERSDWKTAVKIPVGVIPGGSGNGLARSIHYAIGEPYEGNAVISSVLNVVRGRVAPMDLVCVQSTGQPVYSFLSFGWGIMADIDIESERLRAIGEARFTLWAVIRAIGLRKYRGRLSYLPVAGYATNAVKRSKRNLLLKR